MTRNTYGYARLPGAGTSELLLVRLRLREFARERGLHLADQFVARETGEVLTVWDQMTESCHETGVQDIVIPSLSHLDPEPMFASLARDLLAKSIGGRVWVADEPDEIDATTSEHPEEPTAEASEEPKEVTG